MEPTPLGILVIIFSKGRNLPNRRSLGKQNPYCIARIGHDAKRTPSDLRGGQTPKWDHEVRFSLNDIPEHQNLKLSVLDENDSKPDLIGDTIIHLSDAINSHPSTGFDNWHELQFKGKYAGEIYLEMTFYSSRPNIPPKPKIKKSSLVKSTAKSQRPHSLNHSTSFNNYNPPISRPLPVNPTSLNSSYNDTTGPLSNMDTMSRSLPDPRNYNLRSRASTPVLRTPPPSGSVFASAKLSTSPQPRRENHTPLVPAGSEDFGFPTLPELQIPSLPKLARTDSHPGQLSPNRTVKRKPVGGAGGYPVNRVPVGGSNSKRNSLDYAHSFDDDDLEAIPFSANDYVSTNRDVLKNLPKIPKSGSNDVLDESTYAPEPRLGKPGKPLPVAPVLSVDPGAGGYTGEGRWDMGPLRDRRHSDNIYKEVLGGGDRPIAPVPARVNPAPFIANKPRLPPKIPFNITREEYIAMESGSDRSPPPPHHIYY